jgi:hypothetical protein
MKPGKPAQEKSFGNNLYDAMRRKAWLLPQTEEEVIAAEQELEQHPVELPLELRDPMAVLRGEQRHNNLLALDADQHEESEELARAARGGKPLSPEIERLMQEDRDAAEQDDDGK